MGPMVVIHQRGECAFLTRILDRVVKDFIFDEDIEPPEKYHYAVKLLDLKTQKVFYDKLLLITLSDSK